MLGITPIQEAPPVYGMNTVKDFQDLMPGECVRLVNARPGNPPDVLKGSDIWLIPGSLNYRPLAPALSVVDLDGNPRIYLWVLDGNTYRLLEVNTAAKPMTVREVTYVTGASGLSFCLLAIGEHIYTLCSSSARWGGSINYSAGKIFRAGVHNSMVEHCFAFAPQVAGVYLTDGLMWNQTGGQYISYAATLVRRTDLQAVDSAGNFIKSRIYLPGDNESFERPSFRKVLHIESGSWNISVDTTLPAEAYQAAIAQGATHLRVYKSVKQASEQNARDAVHYWFIDVPISSLSLAVTSVVLPQNAVIVTTVSAHGLTTAEDVRILNTTGCEGLNDVVTAVGDTTEFTFALPSANPVGLTPYQSGGIVLKGEKTIASVTVPENRTRVTFADASAVEVGDRILLYDIVGTTQLNDRILDVKDLNGNEISFASVSTDMTAYSEGGHALILEPVAFKPTAVDVSGTNVKLVLRENASTSVESMWLNRYIQLSVQPGLYGDAYNQKAVQVVGFETAEVRIRVGTKDIYDVPVAVPTTYYVNGDPFNARTAYWTPPPRVIRTEGIYEYRTDMYLELSITVADLMAVIGTTDSAEAAGAFFVGLNGISKARSVAVMDITAIEWDTTRVLVSTTTAHGFANADTVYIRDVNHGNSINGAAFSIATTADDSEFELLGANPSQIQRNATGGTAAILVGSISDIDLSYPRVTIRGHGRQSGDSIILNDLIGATELNGRIFTVNRLDDDNVLLIGVDSNAVSDYLSGGRATDGNMVVEDDVPDATLVITPAVQLTATRYGPAPSARFSLFVKDRMWLFGVLNAYGTAYYSETPGGDGGTPLDLALAFPEKYRAWWSAEYAIKCISDGGGEESGLRNIGDDIYFFFEERIFSLIGGNPASGRASLVSSTLGCLFPATLCLADVPYFGGKCILFISNQGPAVIRGSGELRLVTEFGIAELWPGDFGEIFKDYHRSTADREYIRQNCSSMFWKSTWTIVYQTVSGSTKTFEYYFNPRAETDADAARGAYAVELASV